MKGKATITLTEAKTGKVISRSVEHNMVTNALRNIFNPVSYSLLHRFDYSALFNGALPMWKNLLSGVMLLGERMEEDADNIIPAAGTIPVATAGDEYAGDNPYRGTLNLAESYPTENGYHFTWDFGTDKANGTIKCVALTSRNFGNAGFHSTDNDGSFVVNPINMENLSLMPETSFEYGQGHYLGTFEERTHLFMSLDSNGGVVFRKYRGVDPSALRINDTVGLAQASEPAWTLTVTPAFELKYEERFFLDTEQRIIYFFGDTEKVSATSMKIQYTGISLDSFTTVVTESVTIPVYCTNYYIGAVWKGHIFYLTPDGVGEYDSSGQLIKLHNAPFASSTIFFTLGDCLMSQSASGYVYCYSWGDISTSTALSRYLFTMPSVDVKPPYAAVCMRKLRRPVDPVWKSEAAVTILSPYMATINNLSQPITKTSEHTLKITYDITN